MSSAAWQYEKLPDDGSVRILKLLANRDGSHVRCELFATQTHRVKYEALSYTWTGKGNESDESEYGDALSFDRKSGDRVVGRFKMLLKADETAPKTQEGGGVRDQDCIHINGQAKTVSSNLYEALICLRSNTEDRHLWVDAICINQDDPQEKANQVANMHWIYANASKVICWLGPHDPGTHRVLEYSKSPDNIFKAGDLARRFRGVELKDHGYYNHNRSWDDHSFMEEDVVYMLPPDSDPGLEPSYTAQVRYPGNTDSTMWGKVRKQVQSNTRRAISLWKDRFLSSKSAMLEVGELAEALEEFLACRYWNRAWIQQEVTCNPETYIYVGDDSVHLDQFIYKLREAGLGRALSWRIVRLRAGLSRQDSSGSFSLLNILHSMRQCKATDPRDLMYAARSMAQRDDLSKSLKVRYDISCDQLFIDFARSYLQLYPNNLDILAYAGFYYNGSYTPRFQGGQRSRIPSWVPDWREYFYRTPLVRALGQQAHFTAGFLTSPDSGRSPSTNFTLLEDNTLLVAGFVLANVGATLHPKEFHESREGYIRFCETWADAHPKFPLGGKYSSFEASDAALRRTLVADTRYKNGVVQGRGCDFRWPPYRSTDEALAKGWYDTKVSAGRPNRADWEDGFEAHGWASEGRLFAMTTGGTYALLPEARINLASDLVIAVFAGDPVLHLLGSLSPDVHAQYDTDSVTSYVYLGECYMDGYMDGQALDLIESGEESWKTLQLI